MTGFGIYWILLDELEAYGYLDWLSSAALSTNSFLPYNIESKQPVSSISSLFTLQDTGLSMTNVKNQKIYHEASKSGIWSVDFKQPHMQIARAYTPIPTFQHETSSMWRDRELRFLIRKEKEGEVSGYLHAFDENAKIELRGPNIEYRIPENVQTVIFLAGGTGIAPALQVATSLFELREKMKPLHLHILWANRLGEDCVGGEDNASYEVEDLGTQGPVVRQLETLKKRHPGRITVEYFVDEEGT